MRMKSKVVKGISVACVCAMVLSGCGIGGTKENAEPEATQYVVDKSPYKVRSTQVLDLLTGYKEEIEKKGNKKQKKKLKKLWEKVNEQHARAYAEALTEEQVAERVAKMDELETEVENLYAAVTKK